ncbi:MAG: hypothetical protein JSV04_01565 [Candidatus Heimdallarchaeota archaeon]|nr:MAG: hypothetical protein JSV04_01565 [Candidatus Heimdallarchaeota archaeon]
MRLQEYINEKGLKAEIVEFNSSTMTVDESIVALGCKANEIIKSMIVVTDSEVFFLVILQGNRRIKTRKLKKLLNVKDIKLASPTQVLKTTGYNVGDVPPISVNLPIILDKLVMKQAETKLYGGGGAPQRLLAISVEELLKSIDPIIADISVPI